MKSYSVQIALNWINSVYDCTIRQAYRGFTGSLPSRSHLPQLLKHHIFYLKNIHYTIWLCSQNHGPCTFTASLFVFNRPCPYYKNRRHWFFFHSGLSTYCGQTDSLLSFQLFLLTLTTLFVLFCN